MSNDQASWLTPRFKTSTTPELLRKLMPDRLVGQRAAMEHFYNKFKTKSEEAAAQGESSYLLEITDAECGLSSNFDIKLCLNELHTLLRNEKFIPVKKQLSAGLGQLEMAWKEMPKPSEAQIEEEKRQLSTVSPAGAYQLNQQTMDDLAARYQLFAAANNPAQFYSQHQAPYGWNWPPPYPPADGYSSPNPNAGAE
jgi:hypothetical protein